ncbi:U4/U6.U5 small nuclear ribonucleoprotein 27 kDa protein [Triplophysa rosa]|uniref:U4/U6.U5 small nuclear ribonucleoprotein 27 kDa protein n=1 Tax=Triplophysa rosa TaxID=992332 RepID=A0A9W7X3H3_TRIRA|nr:U4/U6.U5 small nuclear ribonucleoprotein 27 kDa protein [Triplophysa rosa]
MGRSRSRTPPRRERRRSRSSSRDRERRRRERERSRSRDRDRRRSRSRSPHRRRSRSPRRRSSSLSPLRQKDRREDDRKEVKEKHAKVHQISAEDMEGKTEEEIEMMKTMGFGSFDTSKGKRKEGSIGAFAVNVSQKRKYRSVFTVFLLKETYMFIHNFPQIT